MKQPSGGILIGALVGTALAVGSQSQVRAADESDLDRLDTARARWLTADADHYRYAYERYCECYRDSQPLTVVTVRGGEIEDVHLVFEYSQTEVPALERGIDNYWTIDELFVKLERAYAADLAVRVEYDESHGYPLALFVDYISDFTGDETDIRLLRFEIL